jgi:hypothetical protein
MSEANTQELVQLAWDTLPGSHRRLLEQIGASRWEIVDRPLGEVTRDLLQAPGRARQSRAQTEADNHALGIWVPELRLVLINEAHPAVLSTDQATREGMLTWVAWHEWGHALSVASHTPHDPNEGSRLLALAPPGIRERIRRANYPRREYIHELIAETYALVMRARIEGRPGPPTWLPNEIYQLITRIGA